MSPSDSSGVEGSRSDDMPKTFCTASVKARLQAHLFSGKPSFVNHLPQDILPDNDVNLIQYVQLVWSG